MSDDRIELLKHHIRDVPDFPKPGIVFKDITPLLAEPRAFTACLDLFAERFAGERVDAVVGIESRGFIFGAALAARMTASFVPARKPGKLPAEVDRVEYELEYGTDALEMHVDALARNERVVIVDDLIATGGTAAATVALCARRGATVLGCAFVVELGFLNGTAKLGDTPVLSLITY
ncbi:MAG TPA: adenine phosphoribosyltransferase [Sandaracinaceae bacterium LLY-WYZ-13_1]|nr:adenine phosphoribosyltransferase [Sandaracinaceae bacterium LLY-WYZ-13_1]